MSEMIDRVARVIDPIAFSMMDERGQSAERRDKAREKARAAIAAMREPTEAMMHDGSPFPGTPAGPYAAKQIWQAMIDKAAA